MLTVASATPSGVAISCPLDRFQDLLHRWPCVLQGSKRQDHRELFSAVAGDEIVVTQGGVRNASATACSAASPV